VCSQTAARKTRMVNRISKEVATRGHKPSEIIEKFKYLGMSVAIRNCVCQEVEFRRCCRPRTDVLLFCCHNRTRRHLQCLDVLSQAKNSVFASAVPTPALQSTSPVLYQHRCNQLLVSQANMGLIHNQHPSGCSCVLSWKPNVPPPPPFPPATYRSYSKPSDFSKRNKKYTPPSTISFFSSFPSHLLLRPPLSSKHLQLCPSTFLKIVPPFSSQLPLQYSFQSIPI
jgi:hypothetical protein